MSPLPSWRVLESHYLRADRWIRLRVDRCETAEGVEVSPYYVLEYPDWTHVVAISPDGEVLLVEQYRHGAGAVTLELPAGRMDDSDGSPVVTARRELLEETGCAAETFAVVSRSSPNPASHANTVHTVLATHATMLQAAADDPRERLRVQWVTAEQAYGLALDGTLPAMQAASLFAAFHRLGWIGLKSTRAPS